MNLDFSGKTAIVTGAAHGFGRAIAMGAGFGIGDDIINSIF